MSMAKKKSAKHRKTKVILEFDEDARDKFLTGFQKRKTARKLEAREKRDKVLKEERITLRQQIRDLKASKASKTDMVIPEIEQLVKPEVYDLPDHTVTIANIGDVDFVGKTGRRLGQNMGQMSSESENEGGDATDDDNDKDVETKKKERKEAAATNKSLVKKLASCSNQLSSQQEKSKRNNRRKYIKDKLQAKKTKKKKNHSNKKKKR